MYPSTTDNGHYYKALPSEKENTNMNYRTVTSTRHADAPPMPRGPGHVHNNNRHGQYHHHPHPYHPHRHHQHHHHPHQHHHHANIHTNTLDFEDCQGQFRVATIEKQKTSSATARKFQKFFSPLRVPDHMRVLQRRNIHMNLNQSTSTSTSTSSAPMNGSVGDYDNEKGTGTGTGAGSGSGSGSGTKRSRVDDDNSVTHDEILGSINVLKKKKRKQELAEGLMRDIVHTAVESENVYDRCPAVAEKIKEFLRRDDMGGKALFLHTIGVHGNSLNAFLNGKDQEQCTNKCYKKCYIFLERLRILEGREKSPARLLNETHFPNGFETNKRSSSSQSTSKTQSKTQSQSQCNKNRKKKQQQQQQQSQPQKQTQKQQSKLVSIDDLPIASSEFC